MDGEIEAVRHRNVAIAIAVADSVPRAYLTGAINGANHFLAWAEACGYETNLISDAPVPVTMDRLRQELEEALTGPERLPLNRVILYFAGHGVIREAGEGLWLLSDWSNKLTAVAMEPLKRRLSRFGAQQLTIISDACRSLPAKVDILELTADGVLGRGPFESDPMMVVDKFIAAQDGRQAFMIPGDDPKDDRCLFTGVLLEGLWGANPDAFSKALKDKVTSQSLGTFIKNEARRRAETYGLELVPDVSWSFPEGDDYYYVKGEHPAGPNFTPWPDHLPADELHQGVIVGNDPDEMHEIELALPRRGREIQRLWQRRSQPRAVRSYLEFAWGDDDDDVRGDGLKPPQHSRQTFAVSGATVRQLWSQPGLHVTPSFGQTWWKLSVPDLPIDQVWPILADCGKDRVVAFPSFPGATADLLIGDRGANQLIFRPWGSSRLLTEPVELALQLLEDGGLTLETASDLAVELRGRKHDDPVLGVISAYLYDAIGDIDSIRRMASFYAEYQQAIPFDIALLADLPARFDGQRLTLHVPAIEARRPRTDAEARVLWTTRKMEATSGEVAGLWPWLRQGWAYMEDPTGVEASLVLPGMEKLSRHLRPARFTTLDQEGAERLAVIAGLDRLVSLRRR